MPLPLVEQLREGGRIVIPLGQRYQQTMYVLVKRDGEMVVESREPTFFVPMTGVAEDRRTPPGDDPLSDLGNGAFEELLEPGKPAAWYYLRQATIEPAGASDKSANCLQFKTRCPGRSAQALQALGVDGSRVSEFVVELYAQGDNIKPADKATRRAGQTADQSSSMKTVVPWASKSSAPGRALSTGVCKAATSRCLPAPRVAILGIGLMGATGQWSCDDVRIRNGNVRTVAK